MERFFAESSALLARSPEVLRTLLIGLPARWTETPDVVGGWRPRDIVGHLITDEETAWLARRQRILSHGTSPPFDRFAMLARDGGPA